MEFAFLSHRGYGIEKHDTNIDIIQLKKDLTVCPRMTDGSKSETSFPLYLESSKKIYIPKYYGLQTFGVPDKDRIKYPDYKRIDIPFNGSLRNEQLQPVAGFMTAVNDSKKRGGIINLSCGAGKTVIGLYIISQLRLKTMIIVHKEFLLDQWKERIRQFIPSARVGLIKGEIIDVQDKDIIMASLQSLSMKEYSYDIFQDIGFLVVDEVHRTATRVFSQALKKIQIPYSLGLSATITRKDGMSKVFKWYLGDVVYKNKSKSDNVIVHVEEYFENSKLYREEHIYNYKPNIAKMINNICESQDRNNLICRFVNELSQSNAYTNTRRKFLILSDRKAHLRAIAQLLHNTVSFGFYIGNMKPEELNKSEQKDVILATYSFASEGFDVPNLDTVIFGTPKSDIEQSVGRILRKKPEDRTNIPIIIDIVDELSLFPRQGLKRKAFYKKMGFQYINVFGPVQETTSNMCTECLILEDE